jgi:hypothetical protein
MALPNSMAASGPVAVMISLSRSTGCFRPRRGDDQSFSFDREARVNGAGLHESLLLGQQAGRPDAGEHIRVG